MTAPEKDNLNRVAVRETASLAEIPISELLRRASEDLFTEFDTNGPSARFGQLCEHHASSLIAYWKQRVDFFERARIEGKTQPSTMDERQHRLTVGDEQYEVFQQLNSERDLGPDKNQRGFIATYNIKWVSPTLRGRFGAAATIIDREFSIYDMTIEAKERKDPSSEKPDVTYEVQIDSGKTSRLKRSILKVNEEGETWVEEREISDTTLGQRWEDWDDHAEEDAIKAFEAGMEFGRELSRQSHK